MLESESLKLKEEVKRLTSLLEAARKSKSDTEGRLEELRGIVSKVRRCYIVSTCCYGYNLYYVIKMSCNNVNYAFRDKKRIHSLKNNFERKFLLKAN